MSEENRTVELNEEDLEKESTAASLKLLWQIASEIIEVFPWKQKKNLTHSRKRLKI